MKFVEYIDSVNVFLKPILSSFLHPFKPTNSRHVLIKPSEILQILKPTFAGLISAHSANQRSMCSNFSTYPPTNLPSAGYTLLNDDFPANNLVYVDK